MTTYSIVGLGKLGASMVAAIAKRGFRVIGVDVSQRAVDLVNQGHAPVQETDLESTIAANKDRISATMSHADAVNRSDLTFVIVPTPSDEKGAFSLQYAAQAFKEIGIALRNKKAYHNVVLTSTVLPGSTRYGLIPILEKESGKVCGRDFGLCYSPEFIALGSVIRDFLNPDFTLIGEIDNRAGAQLESCYAAIMENKAPCRRMSIENAELTKISVNTFITTKITFANMLADVCQRIPGGDIDTVTKALGMDTRIGSRYLKGALGYGGPCFPRDNLALSFISRALGTTADVADITDKSNRLLTQRVVSQVKGLAGKNTTVAILGLAYKPFSHVTEESQSIQIARALADTGVKVVAYDPLANENARKELKDRVSVVDSVKDCLAQADGVLVTTPDPEFAALAPEDFVRNHAQVWVLDFWRLLAHKLTGQPGITYIPFGCNVDRSSADAVMRQLWGGR